VVHRYLATDAGRARFWAESAVETDGRIDWVFPDGRTFRSPVVENRPPGRFAVEYVGGSLATFELTEDGAGGTDLHLTDDGVPGEYREQAAAGWVSVLLSLKAAADFAVDLRNHDPQRTWGRRFADN
jgi:hypothetical protein